MKALVTPEILSWARISIGYSADDVAKRLNQKTVTSNVILSWENGDRQPSYAQLEKLAILYKRPIAVFFFPKPPQEKSIAEKLRALPEKYARSLPPEIHYLVRKAQSRKISLYEIYDDALPNDFQHFYHNFKNKNDVQRLASDVRSTLEVSIDDQFSWSDDNIALKKWRSKLEEVGIWIFKESFNNEDESYSGFCLFDTHTPIIYINNGMSPARKIFTLFHELAHLLIGKGGVDFRENVEKNFTGVYQKEEVFCNAFASHFLVPDQSISISDYSDEKISLFAKQYKVSREVILRRYLDKGIIKQSEYDNEVEKYRSQWEQDKNSRQTEKERNKQLGKKPSGPSYYVTRESYLGDKYLSLAFSQYYKNRISESQLADYLDVKVKSLSGLEDYMLGSQ